MITEKKGVILMKCVTSNNGVPFEVEQPKIILKNPERFKIKHPELDRKLQILKAFIEGLK